jgi:hypothetical protein
METDGPQRIDVVETAAAVSVNDLIDAGTS